MAQSSHIALTHTLSDATMGLAVNDQRINATADIVNRRIGGYLHMAGFGIDLHFADGGTVRKNRRVHLIVAADAKRPGGGARLATEGEDVDRLVGAADLEVAALEIDRVDSRLEQLGSAGDGLRRADRQTQWPMTVPAWRIERPECEPPPTLTMSVSPRTIQTFSTGTWIMSATT